MQLGISESALIRHEAAARFFETAPGIKELRVVAPSQRAGDDFVRIQGLAMGGLMGVHRRTLNHLATDLSAIPLATEGRARLSSLGSEALAARAIHTCRKRLKYFKPVQDMPGFPRAVANTLENLRLEAVSPEAIVQAGPGGPDLVRLLDAFEKELSAGDLADRAAIFEAATTGLKTSRLYRIRCPLLFIDVAPRTVLEKRFLEALIAHAAQTYAVLPAADTDGIDVWRALGADVERLDDPETSTSLDRVRRFVFSAEAPEYRALDDSLAVFSAPGEALECVEIARRLRRLAQEGVPYDRTAILLRSPQTYQPLVQDALSRADIPGYFTRGTRRPDPAGRALLALLTCASEGLSASRFAEYLSLGQVPEREPDGSPPARKVPWVPPKDDRQLVFSTLIAPPTPDHVAATGQPLEPVGQLEVPLRWEELLVDAAVIGGQERWARRLLGFGRELRLRLEALADAPAHRAQIERNLKNLENLERFALPVIRFLAELPQTATWHRWLDLLTELVGLTLRETDGVLSLLHELRPMGAVGPIGLEEVRLVLTDRLSFLQEEPIKDRFGRVFVGTLDEASGRLFDVVFIPGLAEGIFPKKAFEDPLLLDEARETIRPGLGVRARKSQEERRLLHLGLGAAERQVVLSYPRMDVVQGRPRVPSFYALDLLRAAEGRIPALRELVARAADAAETRLGWPAPHQPEDAIDEGEYDLAVLGPLIFEPPDAVRGLGRYLIDDGAGQPPNPYLVRSLYAQAGRWRARWGRNDGLIAKSPGVDTAGITKALADHRLDVRSYSPTSLQNFAQCPYKFLLSALYRLRPREEAIRVEMMDPLTRGALFHATQFALFMRLQSEDRLPIDADNLETVLHIADTVLSEVSTRYADDLAPAISEVWTREVESIRLDLRRWLREGAREEGLFRPIRSEMAFGLAHQIDTDRDPNSQDEPVRILDRYLVRGAIDWIDEHTETKALRVIDHKTGRYPKDPPVYVGRGEFLQPIVYALAAEAMFERPVTEGILSYCTQRGGFSTVSIPLDQPARDHLEQVLMTIDDTVARGFFPAAPRPQACRYCDYRAVCGPSEERRMDFKQSNGLEALAALRRTR